MKTIQPPRMDKRSQLRAAAKRALPARLHAHNVEIERGQKLAKRPHEPRLRQRQRRLALLADQRQRDAELRKHFEGMKPTIEVEDVPIHRNEPATKLPAPTA